jgi:RimJ/RimL family protein N-acetyltransferase
MELSTPRLQLRELTPADDVGLHALDGDAAVTRWLSCDVLTEEESRAYLLGTIVQGEMTPRRVWELAVIERASGELIGRVGLKQQADPRDAAIWYVFRRDRWGNGFAQEATRALVDFGFRELALHRVWADIDPENGPSQKLCERLGMRREAHHVENVFLKGEWRGTIIFAVLEREWRALAQAK